MKAQFRLACELYEEARSLPYRCFTQERKERFFSKCYLSIEHLTQAQLFATPLELIKIKALRAEIHEILAHAYESTNAFRAS